MKSKDFNKSLSIGDYDADNGLFLVKSVQFGDLLVPVPRREAPLFETSWNNITKTLEYTIDNDKVALSEIDFALPDGKTYKYSSQASLTFTVANIDYKFDPIDIGEFASSSQPAQKGNQSINTVNVSIAKSDVSVDIPVTGNNKNNTTFAVIIANENYKNESAVEFAKNDGETFKKYCIQTLGIPEINIRYVPDATLNDIRHKVKWISDVANSRPDEANLIFYYAGHGIPDESSRSACLLPVDGYGSDINSGYKLDDLYQTLGKLPVKTITVFMDACFSGAQRSGDMLASARGVVIKARPGAPVGNMVVFSAAQGDETAYPYREKGHGLFTYFLLKKLQETKGDVTLSELGNYIVTNVNQQSILVNNKSQTPTVTPSVTIEDGWKNRKLK